MREWIDDASGHICGYDLIGFAKALQIPRMRDMIVTYENNYAGLSDFLANHGL